jgi:hypothetical protein
MTECEGVN